MEASPSWLDRWMLGALRRIAGPAPVVFALPGYSEQPPAYASLVPTIRFADRGALLRVLLNPEIGFGDAYAAGEIEIAGPLVNVLGAFYRSAHPRTWYSRLLSWAMRRRQRNSLDGSRRNIHHHYDIDTAFYQLWLDPRLVYTCAYFPDRRTSLADAQVAKLDHVCRKLMLQPGETAVEAGCGWGALALHMAKHYGVRVKAYNISREQIAYARARAKREGLAGQVEFIEDDYRNIGGRYDVFVSVGMLEHVGRDHHAEFGDMIHRVVGENGRGLLHFIGRNHPAPFSAWIRKRIFPGAYAPSLREALLPLERHFYSVVDVENLRQHYALTLEHWLEGFERSYDLVVRRFGEEFGRAWRLYLAGSVAAFRAGSLQLFQVVFAGRECRALPWTRAYLYGERQEDGWNRLAS